MNGLIKFIVLSSLAVGLAGTYFSQRMLESASHDAIAVMAENSKAKPVVAVAALAPSAPPAQSASGRTAVLAPDARGQFFADVAVNGRVIKMLVDTGATLVALTQQDAIMLGVLPVSFNVPVQTANGVARAGEARLSNIRIGNVEVTDTTALVLPGGAVSQSLLGMSFLKKLSGFEYAAGNLVWKQ